MNSPLEPVAKKLKTEESAPAKAAQCSFTTELSHVFHRSDDYSVVARLVNCSSKDGTKSVIQLGRFRNGWTASKFIVSLNPAEVQWLIESIPSLIKKAQKEKDCSNKPVLETKEFDKRTFTVGVSRFNFPKGGSAKNMELTQSWIQNDDEVTRNVGIPLKMIAEAPAVLNHLQMVQKMSFDREFRDSKIDTVFTSFLTYVVKAEAVKVLAEPSMNKLLDADLMARMTQNEGVGAINYWIAAKNISMCFEYEHCPTLKSLNNVLKVDSVDYESLTPTVILDAFTEKAGVIENQQEQELFDFVKFMIENLTTY